LIFLEPIYLFIGLDLQLAQDHSCCFFAHGQVGVFQLNIDTRTVLHKSSGVEITPATVDFSMQPESWCLENNYNEKSARLKNQMLGISFSVMYLFKIAGSPLPKPTKVPILALGVQAIANDTSAGMNGLQALVDMARPLPLTDQEPTTPKKTASQEGTARPALAPLLPLVAAGQHVQPLFSVQGLQLQTGPDGRVRLARTAPKRPCESTEASVPTPTRQRVEGTARHGVHQEYTEQTRSPDRPRTPSPVPTELAAEEESPSFQELLEGFAAPVSDSSS
jgi:hypothetical protein